MNGNIQSSRPFGIGAGLFAIIFTCSIALVLCVVGSRTSGQSRSTLCTSGFIIAIVPALFIALAPKLHDGESAAAVANIETSSLNLRMTILGVFLIITSVLSIIGVCVNGPAETKQGIPIDIPNQPPNKIW